MGRSNKPFHVSFLKWEENWRYKYCFLPFFHALLTSQAFLFFSSLSPLSLGSYTFQMLFCKAFHSILQPLTSKQFLILHHAFCTPGVCTCTVPSTALCPHQSHHISCLAVILSILFEYASALLYRNIVVLGGGTELKQSQIR